MGKVYNIAGGGGAQRGANSQQAGNDVASTSF